MIDNFSILLSHGLLLLTFWLLSRRNDLDTEPPPPRDPEPEGFAVRRINAKPPAKRHTPDA